MSDKLLKVDRYDFLSADDVYSLHAERHLAWKRVSQTKQEIFLRAYEDCTRDSRQISKDIRTLILTKP